VKTSLYFIFNFKMGEIMETKKNGFVLPKETVTVKFVKRKQGMAANVNDDHVISGGMLSGAKKKFYAPLQRNGAIANILNKEEKEYLEEVTGLNLSVYGDFWTTFNVSLFKEDANNTFDLDNPMDYISVKLLEALTNDIALTWKDRKKKGTYQFVITRSDEEFKEKKTKLDSKKDAWKIYGKLEDDRDKLIAILKMMSNQRISDDSKLDWIQGRVEEKLDANPASFLAIINDPSFDTKVLIGKAIDAGYILRKGNLYSTVDGLELTENGAIASFDNAVKYLDNPKYQDVRSLMEARIDNAK
jgi:hypothetical protein